MTTAITRYKAGDKVRMNQPGYGGLWTVKSVGPKNYVLEPELGGRNLRAPHHMVVDADTPAPVRQAPTAWYTPGEFVRITSGKFAGLYMVLADKGAKVNVVKPGGDGGRYVRAIKGANLVKVDPTEVLR